MTEDDFKRFASSYAGMDGGNQEAPVWVCGIEWGGKAERVEDLQPVMEPSSWTKGFKDLHAKGKDSYRTWQYHQKVAKLLTHAWNAATQTRGGSVPHWRDYRDNHLYASNGNEFKLNLFPLSSSKSDSWPETYREHHVLRDKARYQELCREARFPFIRSLSERYRPKVVIGTGIAFVQDFASAFGFSQEDQSEEADGGLRWFTFANRDQTLIVCPFLGGRNGLTKNEHLQVLGRRVARHLEPGDFRIT